MSSALPDAGPSLLDWLLDAWIDFDALSDALEPPTRAVVLMRAMEHRARLAGKIAIPFAGRDEYRGEVLSARDLWISLDAINGRRAAQLDGVAWALEQHGFEVERIGRALPDGTRITGSLRVGLMWPGRGITHADVAAYADSVEAHRAALALAGIERR